jgi:hypothetical protein
MKDIRFRNGSRIAVGKPEDAYRGALQRGEEWLIIDPFTPNERAVLADSEEGRAWKAAHPPTGEPLWITGVDLEKRTVTFGTEPPKRRKK